MAKQDYLIRAFLGNNQARVFALRTTEVVKEAQMRHFTSPTASAALGRTLTVGLVLGAMLKGEETVTVQIKGDGPLKGIVVSSNSKGEVKGYVGNPSVDLPLNTEGKLAVGEAVGSGNLHVIHDLGLKGPYQGSVPLQTGEIGDDFAYYFGYSEQTPSAVVLGVRVDTDGTPLGAGGIIVQLLPGTSSDDDFVDELESYIRKIPSVSSLFAEEKMLEKILEEVFTGLNLRIIDSMPVKFRCDCSKERFERGLIALGTEELRELIGLKETIETVCHFCGETYCFSNNELKAILAEMDAPRE